jgi:murein DD-endopeptidase MepM/ murein hydrolase activator NlpD
VKIVTDQMNGRAFVKVLQEDGVEKAQVYRVLTAFEGQLKFDRTSRKDRFIAAIDKKTKLLRAFEWVVSPLEIWQARENDQGLLTAARLDLKVATEEVVGAFYVSKSLAKSIDWSIFEPGIDGALDDAYDGHTSTDAFEEGGTVRAIAIERTALGEFAGYESIVAAEYRPPDPSKSPVRIYSFKGDKSKGYFDERGRQPDGGGWVNPVPGAPITSRFNPKRMHPILKRIHPHNGTDYGAPTGTPIHAAYRGKVTWIGMRGAAGNLVLIEHPNGVETGYYHMSRYAEGLKVGQRVATNQLIGYVGTTGRSTGPHLHFAAKRDGKFFDAEKLRMDSFRVVHVDDRPAFLRHKAELDARLDAIPLPEPPPPEPEPKKAEELAAADAKADVGDGGPGADDAKAGGDEDEAAAKPAAEKPEPAKSAADDADDEDLEDLVGPDLR